MGKKEERRCMGRQILTHLGSSVVLLCCFSSFLGNFLVSFLRAWQLVCQPISFMGKETLMYHSHYNINCTTNPLKAQSSCPTNRQIKRPTMTTSIRQECQVRLEVWAWNLSFPAQFCYWQADVVNSFRSQSLSFPMDRVDIVINWSMVIQVCWKRWEKGPTTGWKFET